jgi:2-oxoisovalerate dehydrogenase E1 component beta subunit
LALPLDRCFVDRAGTDITLVAWGAMMREVLEAAAELEESGISAEVIDVATLSVLDDDTIIRSVAKTKRCLVVHEAAGNGGFGGEIAARVAEACFFTLLAPVSRVCGYDTVMPLAKLESRYIPSAARISKAARRLMEYA